MKGGVFVGELKREAMKQALARYPAERDNKKGNARKRHALFIKLWEKECKKKTALLLAQQSGGA